MTSYLVKDLEDRYLLRQPVAYGTVVESEWTADRNLAQWFDSDLADSLVRLLGEGSVKVPVSRQE
jgi:hypothetical protein